ncbi:unnamed protein product [Spirodela intermedia]|uniref:Reverse transcriptase n=1 Tax=Spirodela intermedia TaxID=51605 RepID=A0A811G4Z0_SPIIN|nr:unnamed protein product [Spirodela intermedia]
MSTHRPPFRFQTMWLQHENFQSFVRNHWYGQISDSPMENLSYRLRNLKLHLKWWNRHIYGNVHTQAIKEIFRRKVFTRSWKATFLALIPKNNVDLSRDGTFTITSC